MQGQSDGTCPQSNLRTSEASKTPGTSRISGVGCVSASGRSRERASWWLHRALSMGFPVESQGVSKVIYLYPEN